MSHAIHRRAPAVEQGPPRLELMLRQAREDWMHNVRPSIRRHKSFVGAGERRRVKARLALRRARKRVA